MSRSDAFKGFKFQTSWLYNDAFLKAVYFKQSLDSYLIDVVAHNDTSILKIMKEVE